MTAEYKAKKFATAADQEGWESKIELRGDEAHVTCTRGQEELYIWWRENSLIETPKYTFMGNTINTHNAAGAYRQLRLHPDPKKVYKRKRKVQLPKPDENGEVPIIRHRLPFDIYESSNKEILGALRGSRMVWLNGGTGLAETSMIPYKVKKQGGEVILMNTDLDDVFYLASNSADRAYVSFMDELGRFRAVYLDQILQVS